MLVVVERLSSFHSKPREGNATTVQVEVDGATSIRLAPRQPEAAMAWWWRIFLSRVKLAVDLLTNLLTRGERRLSGRFEPRLHPPPLSLYCLE